ncbi:DUF3558 domain-containing protein [Nocardia cyriacigeorgica]|uniref:DUF3558 domain-containing protein n=1 Tax=Nocardia cyriacigeorgica TaxID=135487 RepID=UPI00189348E0|nr:DUF3558 domain-containing protein [Nocardia cyriacigeorgica]MBF6456599.1 DUF3558 domain-containing protein [Nocardia cyriacigeorgica]MBF6478540.1 DUF3558 domain-containing protein [Nocardia cyriacigeorgica]MBF6551404.1 DUF3558 domain-containing protein [Nocardia cyriacigeorgica]
MMNLMRKSAYAVAAGLSAVMVLAGCGSSTDGTAEPAGGSTGTSAAGQSIAEDVPSGFAPCEDIPQEVLDSEGLHSTGGEASKDNMQRGEIKWRGCRWVVSDGYGTSISATNLTLEMIREKANPGTQEGTVSGRTVLYAPDDAGDTTQCRLNAQMEGGSLEIMVDNPNSRRKTGHEPACDIVLRLAGKVLPLIPAGA